jgi:hypothetical protein
MSQSPACEPVVATPSREHQLRILARSLFRHLQSHGFQPLHVVRLSTELISLVTQAMRREGSQSPG